MARYYMTIKAKYDGACKLCGAVWNVGDDLYYQRTPKAICTDHECFTEQGGSDTYQTSFKKKERDTIIARIPDIEVSDDIKIQADVLRQYIVVAHAVAKDLYPEQDINTHVFGQIRSKLVDQLLKVTQVLGSERTN